jgi:hypothetical protein
MFLLEGFLGLVFLEGFLGIVFLESADRSEDARVADGMRGWGS